MADSIHMLLANFRENILTSLAKLEFQIRDLNQLPPLIPISSLVSSDEIIRKHSEDIKILSTNLDNIYRILSELQEVKEEKTGFLNIKPSKDTKNIIVSTPALQAAVSMANDMESLNLDNDEDEIVEIQDDEDENEDENEVVEIQDDEDENEVVEEEAEEEEVEEEEEEEAEEAEVEEAEAEEEEVEEAEEEAEAEEEEGIEVEEFTYKGTVYQRDEDGNVYLDGDEIGHWNGKKILFN